MTEHPIERLSEYLDGELAGKDRAALEAHVATCTQCSETLDELRAVAVQARALEDRAPATDLWPGIAARLRPRGVVAHILGRFVPGGRQFTFSMPQLAAAGLVLALLSAGTVWLVLRGGPSLPQAPGVSGPTGTGAFATFDESRYVAAVAELERALRENRAELDTATVRVLEENLAIIDRATEQARRALLADPANPYLNGHLAEQLKLKIRLLQRATEVVTAHS